MAIKAFNKEYEDIYKYPLSGQKDVYKVTDEDNIYILKIVCFNEINEIERSYREAEFLKNMKHEGYFPEIYNIQISFSEKKFYILEEYIEGNTLEMEKNNYKGREKKVIQLLYKLVIGMSELWENNIVHRDLKPSNIIIKPNGDPVILDLGIAKFLDLSPLTLSEKMPYSNYYFAPEQYKNLGHLISERTDFFVLGILTYELYTGEHPFNRENNNLLNGIYKETGNKNFDILISKLLKVQPYERFRTYEDFEEYLEEYLKLL